MQHRVRNRSLCAGIRTESVWDWKDPIQDSCSIGRWREKIQARTHVFWVHLHLDPNTRGWCYSVNCQGYKQWVENKEEPKLAVFPLGSLYNTHMKLAL